MADRIVALRRQRFTARHIASVVAVSPATVSRVLARAKLSRLKDIEPAEPVRRYEHDEPGDMIHIDIKKLGRFDRVVVHSERGRDTLAGHGVSPEKLRVVPHPVFRSDPPRADDGRTVLAPGVIRPYKGLPDAIRATLAVDGARSRL